MNCTPSVHELFGDVKEPLRHWVFRVHAAHWVRVLRVTVLPVSNPHFACCLKLQHPQLPRGLHLHGQIQSSLHLLPPMMDCILKQRVRINPSSLKLLCWGSGHSNETSNTILHQNVLQLLGADIEETGMSAGINARGLTLKLPARI